MVFVACSTSPYCLSEILSNCSQKMFIGDCNFIPDTLIQLVRCAWVVGVQVFQQNIVARREVRRPGWPDDVTQDVIFQTTSGSRAVSVVAPSCWHQISKPMSWASSSVVCSITWCHTDVMVTVTCLFCVPRRLQSPKLSKNKKHILNGIFLLIIRNFCVFRRVRKIAKSYY